VARKAEEPLPPPISPPSWPSRASRTAPG